MADDRVSRYGWDTDALLYPSLDRDGAILLAAAALFALHFGELFGVNAISRPLFGVFPAEYVYQVTLGVLYVLFAGLLYREWPEADA